MRSILIPDPQKGSSKECAYHRTVVLISRASKVYLKCCMLGFRIMQTKKFQMSKLDLEKEEELEIKFNICWIIEKAREFQKNIYLCFTDYAKAFDCVIINCGKLLKRPPYLSPEKHVCGSTSNSENPDGTQNN